MSRSADARGAEISVALLLDEVESVLRVPSSAVRSTRQEANSLVAAVLQQPLWWPVVNCGALVDLATHAHATRAAERLALGMPFAYAVGTAPFRALILDVDERALIPRPETELLIDIIRSLSHGRKLGVVADVGTGSGALALSLATEVECTSVIATDISLDALELARTNAQRLSASARARLDFRHGDALAPLAGERLDLLVSNPPYISFSELAELPKLVRDWEPPNALVCANDGLAVTRQIVHGAESVLAEGALLALEVDSRRGNDVRQLVEATMGFAEVTLHQDLTGRDRFVTARWRLEKLQ